MHSGPVRVDFDQAEVGRDHRSRIYRYLLSLARDTDVAEDPTQETFLRACTGPARCETTRCWRRSWIG